MSETRFINVPLEFNLKLWALKCVHEIDYLKSVEDNITDEEVAVYCLDMHPATVGNLRQWAKKASMPDQYRDVVSISRMLKISNALGIDPRKYFVIESGY